MVRHLEAAASGDWWLYVDLDASEQAGTGQDSTLELCIVLAASLAERGFRSRRRVGLTLAGPGFVRLEPRSGPAHRWQILRALSMAAAGDHALVDLLHVQRPPRTATLIVITPTVDSSWVASVRRRPGVDITTILIDPTEFGGAVGQGSVVSALTRNALPYTRVSRRLLIQAYPHLGQGETVHPARVEAGTRYLKRGGTNWRNLG